MELSIASNAVLGCLRANSEGHSETHEDGSVWFSVYLPNARAAVVPQMSAHQFAGHLAELTKAGFYKSYDDGFFGQVKS